jgi:peroxiredoxin
VGAGFCAIPACPRAKRVKSSRQGTSGQQAGQPDWPVWYAGPALFSGVNSMKKWVMIVAVLAGVLGAGAWLRGGGSDQAPQLAFSSLAGEASSMEQLRGKVVLVNFWATSCSGCIKEMPQLVDTHQKYASQGYQTVAVAMSYDPPEFVREYASAHKLPFFVTLDNQGSMAKAFGEIRLTPTSILIDKNGKVVKRYLGEPDFNELHAQIEKLLKA